jgi:hypothetical protein
MPTVPHAGYAENPGWREWVPRNAGTQAGTDEFRRHTKRYLTSAVIVSPDFQFACQNIE